MTLSPKRLDIRVAKLAANRPEEGTMFEVIDDLPDGVIGSKRAWQDRGGGLREHHESSCG